MDPHLYMLLALGAVALISIIYGTLNYKINKELSDHNNRLVKALISRTAAEYAAAEASPEQHIREMKIENDLALRAAELEERRENREIAIPI